MPARSCALRSRTARCSQLPDFAALTKGVSFRVPLVKTHAVWVFSKARIRSAELCSTARANISGLGPNVEQGTHLFQRRYGIAQHIFVADKAEVFAFPAHLHPAQNMIFPGAIVTRSTVTGSDGCAVNT